MSISVTRVCFREDRLAPVYGMPVRPGLPQSHAAVLVERVPSTHCSRRRRPPPGVLRLLSRVICLLDIKLLWAHLSDPMDHSAIRTHESHEPAFSSVPWHRRQARPIERERTRCRKKRAPLRLT